jgi:hypothetical protein
VAGGMPAAGVGHASTVRPDPSPWAWWENEAPATRAARRPVPGCRVQPAGWSSLGRPRLAAGHGDGTRGRERIPADRTGRASYPACAAGLGWSPPAGNEPATPSLPSMVGPFGGQRGTLLRSTKLQVTGLINSRETGCCEAMCGAAAGKSLARTLLNSQAATDACAGRPRLGRSKSGIDRD